MGDPFSEFGAEIELSGKGRKAISGLKFHILKTFWAIICPRVDFCHKKIENLIQLSLYDVEVSL